MNTYWISLPCDLLSSLASFQCSLLHHLHLSSDLGLSKYVNQHSHLNLSRNVRLSVLYDLDFNSMCLGIDHHGQRCILGCKDQIPVTSFVCCLDSSTLFTSCHISIFRYVHCTFKDLIISSFISHCLKFQSKFSSILFSAVKFDHFDQLKITLMVIHLD